MAKNTRPSAKTRDGWMRSLNDPAGKLATAYTALYRTYASTTPTTPRPSWCARRSRRLSGKLSNENAMRMPIVRQNGRWRLPMVSVRRPFIVFFSARRGDSRTAAMSRTERTAGTTAMRNSGRRSALLLNSSYPPSPRSGPTTAPVVSAARCKPKIRPRVPGAAPSMSSASRGAPRTPLPRRSMTRPAITTGQTLANAMTTLPRAAASRAPREDADDCNGGAELDGQEDWQDRVQQFAGRILKKADAREHDDVARQPSP